MTGVDSAPREPPPERPGEPRIEGFPPGTEDLAGLALSGGGVRSATFALGALQALRDLDILKAFDYLSTVSGGGFTGAWWSAWLSRPPAVTGGSPFPPPEQLEPSRFPPVLLPGDGGPAGAVPGLPPPPVPPPSPPPTAVIDPVHHLRLFANYLTPRRGLFSADTWRGITFYVRTLLFTWLMLLPLLLAAVMGAQWLFAGDALRKVELGDAGVPTSFLCSLPDDYGGPSLLSASACRAVTPIPHVQVLKARLAYAAAPLIVLAVLLVTLSVLWLLHATAHSIAALLGVAGAATLVGVIVLASMGDGDSGRLARIAGLAAALAIASHGVLVIQGAYEERRVRHDVHRVELGRWQSWTLSTMVVLAAVLAVGGFGHELVWFLVAPDTGAVWQGVRKAGGWGAVLAAVASAAFAAYKTIPSGRVKDSSETLGPTTSALLLLAPYIVLGVLLAAFSWVGWVLPAAWAQREARLPAAGALVTWASLFALGFGVFEWVRDRLRRAGAPARRWWRWSPIDNAVLSGAVLVAAVLALDGAWRWWFGEAPVGPGQITRACARFGGAFALGFAAGELIRGRERWNGRALLLAALASVGLLTELWSAGVDEPGRLAWQILLLLVLWVVGLGWMVDPNLLSIHAFYKARLTRAYLGASNSAPGRGDHRGSAPGDDMALTELLESRTGRAVSPCQHDAEPRRGAGPRDVAALGRELHLLPLPLRLGARRLSLHRRVHVRAVVARHRDGHLRCRGQPDDGSADAERGADAAAVAVQRAPRLLGAHAVGPALERAARAPVALLPPARDARPHGQLGAYCYLTDGGHFDNTGLYALVERGCRYIVVCDCGADPRLGFEDIGVAIRRCRIDFGVEIDLAIDDFRAKGRAATRRARTSCGARSRTSRRTCGCSTSTTRGTPASSCG